jgi:hypothetical protein
VKEMFGSGFIAPWATSDPLACPIETARRSTSWLPVRGFRSTHDGAGPVCLSASSRTRSQHLAYSSRALVPEHR